MALCSHRPSARAAHRAPGKRGSRLQGFCRRAAKRVLEDCAATPFPHAVTMKPLAARAPRRCRLAGVIAGWAFYDKKETP